MEFAQNLPAPERRDDYFFLFNIEQIFHVNLVTSSCKELFFKKLFWKILQNSQEKNPDKESFTTALLTKKLNGTCFPLNFAKYFVVVILCVCLLVVLNLFGECLLINKDMSRDSGLITQGNKIVVPKTLVKLWQYHVRVNVLSSFSILSHNLIRKKINRDNF